MMYGVTAAAVVLLLAGAADVNAQGLGRLQRAVKDRVNEASAPSSPAPAAGSSTRGTANFTAAQIDALADGLVVEAERRSSLAAELAALEPRPDYDNCRVQYAMSEAGVRAYEAYAEVLMKYSADPQSRERQEEFKAATGQYERAVKGACGPSPEDAPRLRSERQGEPESAAAERAGMSRVAYARLKELVLPFCAAGLDGGRAASIPSGHGKSYSYSAEDAALLAPRCGRLLPLLNATM
jgi:hypothetical protein